jgi:hypothetical protein
MHSNPFESSGLLGFGYCLRVERLRWQRGG